MNDFLDQLISPKSLLPRTGFEYWRQRIIGIGLLAATVLLTGIFGINLNEAIQNQDWPWVIIYTITYAFLFLVTFSRQAPFPFRAATVLVIFYAFGLTSAIQSGTPDFASLWFIVFSLSAVIFINARAGVIAVVLNTATLLVVAYGLQAGWFISGIQAISTDPNLMWNWAKMALFVFAVGTTIVAVYGLLINGLEKSLLARDEAKAIQLHNQEMFERRSRDIQRRENQLRTAAEISRAISAELNQEQLLNRVVELVRERFDLYYVGVFLMDTGGTFAILQAGTGEAGKAMLQAGHRLSISGTSMIGWSITRRQARIALDVGQDAVRFSNPYLPDTRSELALPMISGSQVIGAITVQSVQPEAFDEEDILVLQGVADSLAIAIQNARLFQQAEASLREVRSLHQRYLGEAWSEMVSLQGNLTYAFENPASKPVTEGGPFKLEKPIAIRDQVIGSLMLESDQPTWESEDEAFVDAVISQAAVALENVRLLEASQQASQHDRILAELSSQAWSTADVDQILKKTLRQLVQALQATHGTIILETPASHPDA